LDVTKSYKQDFLRENIDFESADTIVCAFTEKIIRRKKHRLNTLSSPGMGSIPVTFRP